MSSANVKMCGVTLPYIYIKRTFLFSFFFSFGEGAYVVLVHSTSHRIHFLFVRDKVCRIINGEMVRWHHDDVVAVVFLLFLFFLFVFVFFVSI